MTRHIVERISISGSSRGDCSDSARGSSAEIASMERNMAGEITIHRIRPGEARAGCDPRGVQILYKESTTLGGDPNLAYLTALLERHGFRVEEGDRVSDTPLKYLCVAGAGGTVTREDVLEVLKRDQQVDLSNVDRPEGNWGDE